MLGQQRQEQWRRQWGSGAIAHPTLPGAAEPQQKNQKEERGTQSSSSGAALNIFMLAGHARSSGPMNEDPSACGRVPPLMRLRRGWLDEWGARFLPPFLGVRLGCKIRKQAAAEAAVATQRKNVGRPSKQKWGGHLSEHQQQEGIMRDFNVTQCRISGWSFRLFAFLSAFIYGTHPHDPCLSILSPHRSKLTPSNPRLVHARAAYPRAHV